MMSKELIVGCPSCKKKFKYYTSENRPFCSDRCKMVDLGHWFDESYAVKGKTGTVYIEDPELLGQSENEDY
jgi:endogenous inhibitor of DNA gyrase (YacG/DUF329 family)